MGHDLESLIGSNAAAKRRRRILFHDRMRVGPVDGNYSEVIDDVKNKRTIICSGEGNVGFVKKFGCGVQIEGEFERGENPD